MATNRKTGAHKVSRGINGETYVSEPTYAMRGYVFSEFPKKEAPPDPRVSAATSAQRLDEMHPMFRKFITIRKD